MTPNEWVLSAPTILTVAGLDFTVYSNGMHIVVYHMDALNRRHEYHLWPSTGRWRHKTPIGRWGIGTGTDGPRVLPKFKGVRGLVCYMQEVLTDGDF
jgi:hypothetical protein